MSSSTPLKAKDQLQNSSDTNTEWSSPTTTPLRIAKRGSPQLQPRGVQLARRQSSSYNHLKKNNLVTRSPFRSHIPTPAKPFPLLAPTRRVSGEKRARPISLHDQAENEHPLGFKRRQSKAFQGLLEKEPVTKSPFRRVPSDEPSQPITPTSNRKYRKKAPTYDDDEELAPPPPPKQVFSPRNSPSPSRVPNPSASPARPSLVSKRLHGPRDASLGHSNKRARRKTVSFSEHCDILTIDNVELDENAFDWVTDEDEDQDDVRFISSNDLDDSYDSSQAGDDSITGMVDSMLQDADPSTPPHDDHPLPDDLEAEDGVPYGRTHHAERAVAAHHMHDIEVDEPIFPRPSDTFSTPPHSSSATPIGPVSPGSQMPLGRSTHSERVKAHKEDGIEEDVQMLPPSPSPAKRTSTLPHMESLMPKFELEVPQPDDKEISAGVDPFAMPLIKDEPRPAELSFVSTDSREPGMDHVNAPVGHSEASRPARDPSPYPSELPITSTPPLSPPRNIPELGHRPSIEFDLDSPPPPGRLGSYNNDSLTRSGSPTLPQRFGSPGLGISSRSGSPLQFSSSLQQGLVKAASSASLNSPNGSPSGRSPRISREDVQRRLMKKRSVDSPLREVVDVGDTIVNLQLDKGDDTDEEDLGRPVSPSASKVHIAVPLTRQNPTYDGIISIDPDPQPIDPPRPDIPIRSHSIDGIPSEPGLSSSKPFTGLTLDFGSGFQSGDSGLDMGNDLAKSIGDVPLGDMRSALDRLMEDVAGGATLTPDGKGVRGLKVEAVTAGVQAGQFQIPPNAADPSLAEVDSIMDDDEAEEEDSMDCDEPEEHPAERRGPKVPVLSNPQFALSAPELSKPAIAPPPPAKDAIRQREELIKQKKREARRREEDEDMGLRTPPRNPLGRPARQRSHSTSEADASFTRQSLAAKRRTKSTTDGGLLDVMPVDEEDPLADSIDRELRKLGASTSKYHVREHSETIYASSDNDRVSHMDGAGDLNGGKAWRTVRRPSDMNEYSKQIKELRAKEGIGKAHGKVFVKVLGVKNLNVPLPDKPTAISCTLNNGIHFVTTPECRLSRDSRIEQEFELIETNKLEITLTLKIRRDPHIIAQFKANTPPPPPPVHPPPPASKGGGMRSFFRGAPKKSPKISTPPPASPPVHRLQENLARYLTPDGTLARAFVMFKDIAKHCDTRLFETSFPLIGQKLEAGKTSRSVQVGELVLQVFRLPPLPGIPPNQLPQSLEECHRGLRHINWHKLTYFEGTLTQMGGGCTSWRRRHLRVIGANLVAFNDVTKRATATIDLKKAVAVEDDQEARDALSPASGSTARTSRYMDEYECPYGVERSFRLIFPANEEILFYADSDEEKARWLEVLRALVGHIPPKPLWAELIWQRQQELSKQQPATSSSNSATSPRR